MERDCESELSKLNIEQNACIYHFGASVIHGQRSNILRLRNNEAAKAEKKRLEAQLADAESQLEDTKKDHEYDVRQNGYDGLSDDLNKELEDTLNDITYNSEKQEQVISQMLNRVVGNYQQAYDKIQQIINSTGFVPNKDLSNNLGNLGTSNGAQNQVDNSMTNAPNYRPDDWTDVNTGQIQNGTTQDKNNQIQGDISKNPDLSNRPVAEITLSPGHFLYRKVLQAQFRQQSDQMMQKIRACSGCHQIQTLLQLQMELFMLSKQVALPLVQLQQMVEELLQQIVVQ